MRFSAKLSILLLSITVSVIAVVSFVAYALSHKALEKQIHHEMQSYAAGTLDTIDRTLFERIADMKVLSTDSIISSPESTPKQITARLIEYRNKYKTYASLSFFDLNRIRIADTSGLKLGKQHKPTLYFQNALDKELCLNIAISESLTIPVIHFTSLVKDNDGEAFGLVVARIPLSKLHDIIAPPLAGHTHDDQQKPEGLEGLEIDLIDADGLLLYSNYNRKGILKDNLLEHKEFKAILAADEEVIITTRDPLEGDTDFCVHAHEHGHLDFPGSGWTIIVRIPVEVALAPVIQLRNAMAAISIAIVVIAITASLIFSRTISKPITKLRDAATEIGKGRLDTRIESISKDEIGQLTVSFNQMTENLQKSTTSIENLNAANQQLQAGQQQLKASNQQLNAKNQQLEDSRQQLKAANQQLESEITNRKEAEDRRAQLLRKVESVNNELKDFAYIVSHDLKTPLRGISTLAHWISDDYADKLGEDGKGQMELLLSRVGRMHNLIEGVLQYSSVGRIREELAEVELGELVPEVIDNVAAPENISITIEDELPAIVCEHTRIMQVFQNLLSNAVKYMDKPAGQIRIGCVDEGDCWKFSVADNGPGIEVRHFERIFKVFQTVSGKDGYESTGVGLSVVKKIVEMYGGKIWVESEVGKGSSFFFTFAKPERRNKDAKLEANIAH